MSRKEFLKQQKPARLESPELAEQRLKRVRAILPHEVDRVIDPILAFGSADHRGGTEQLEMDIAIANRPRIASQASRLLSELCRQLVLFGRCEHRQGHAQPPRQHPELVNLPRIDRLIRLNDAPHQT